MAVVFQAVSDDTEDVALNFGEEEDIGRKIVRYWAIMRGFQRRLAEHTKTRRYRPNRSLTHGHCSKEQLLGFLGK